MAKAYVNIKFAKGSQRVSNILPTATADQVDKLVRAIDALKASEYDSASIVIETPLTIE